MDNDITPPDETPRGASTATDDPTPGGANPGDSSTGGSGQPGPEPKRLLRDTDSAVLGGVAAGVGRYLGLDPILVRLGLIVLALTGGVGIIAYVIAWVVIPADDGSDPAREMQRVAHSIPTWLQVIAVLLVALFVTGQLHGFPGTLAWVAVLIGAGILLFRDSDRPATAGGATSRPAEGATHETPDPYRSTEPGRPAGSGARSGVVPPYGGAGAPVPSAPLSAPVPPAAPPRPRSILGRLTFGVLLVWTGIAALLDNVGAIDLVPRQYAAMALVIVGGALVVGAWWGRARGLIFVGLLLLPVLLVAGFPTGAVRGGVGDRLYAPQTLSEVAAGYELLAGQMTIDLSALTPVGDALTVTARHGVGELVVIVPPGVDVVANGWLLAGEATILDRVDQGVGVDYSHRTTAPGSRGEIRLDIHQGLGSLVVRHAR